MPELSPEVKQALEKQKENCIFCKIIKGEVPANKVIEDDHVIGLMDINPAKKGHILLMPKEHYPIMPFLPKETFKRLFEISRILGKAQKKALVTHDYSVFIANGAAAGQQSQHFMIHLIPRDPEDGLKMSELQGAEADQQKLQEVSGLVSHNLPIMMENHFKEMPAEWHAPKNVSSAPAMTKDRVIQIIEQNPQLKSMIMEHPAEFLEQTKVHDQLKQIFATVDPKEIVEHYNPGALAGIEQEQAAGEQPQQTADPEQPKEPEQEREQEQTEEQTPQQEKRPAEKKEEGKDHQEKRDGVDLDDISRLFR
jgi:histidine triad (HIT) family protein